LKSCSSFLPEIWFPSHYDTGTRKVIALQHGHGDTGGGGGGGGGGGASADVSNLAAHSKEWDISSTAHNKEEEEGEFVAVGFGSGLWADRLAQLYVFSSVVSPQTSASK
jgi:hypothetical protein